MLSCMPRASGTAPLLCPTSNNVPLPRAMASARARVREAFPRKSLSRATGARMDRACWQKCGSTAS